MIPQTDESGFIKKPTLVTNWTHTQGVGPTGHGEITMESEGIIWELSYGEASISMTFKGARK